MPPKAVRVRYTHTRGVWAFSVRKRGEATGRVCVKVQPSHALSPDCASLSPISLKLAAGTHAGMAMRGMESRSGSAALGVATWQLGVRAMPARRRAMGIGRVARRRYPLLMRRDRAAVTPLVTYRYTTTATTEIRSHTVTEHDTRVEAS